jgi:hypothetical protein
VETSANIRANAICIAKAPGPELRVSAPSEVQLKGNVVVDGIPLPVDAVNPTSSQHFFCSLTGIEGYLVGTKGAWVGTYLKPRSDGKYAWKLGEGSYPFPWLAPLGATARCAR